MNSGKIKISKLKAARRQLETAIRIYFDDGDPVSIHTLAAASLEILKSLDKQGPNTGTIFDDVKQRINPEFHKQFEIALKSPQNFFKHADRDAEKVLEFNLDLPEIFLWEAALKYGELAQEMTLELAAYKGWFTIQNPGVIKKEFRKQYAIPELGNLFGPNQRAEFFENFARVVAKQKLPKKPA
jgi:hypothetical protein